MKTATAAKIAAQFDDYLDASREQPILVTRGGKAVAVLVAVHDKAEAEEVASRRSRSLRSVLAEGDEQIQMSGAIPHAQFWREVEKRRRSKRPSRTRNGAADRGTLKD